MSTTLFYTLEDSLVKLFVNDSTGKSVFLYSISNDCSVSTLQSFMLDCVAKAADVVPTAPYTASDIFRPDGSVRGVTLSGELNRKRWLVQINGKRLVSKTYDGHNVESDVVYIAHRLGRIHGFDDTTLTFQLVCFALRALTRISL